ncbi:hypothetical protein BT93_G1263 [Corymbia citriodora subsp. variegata]|nr:hypothetical protein BT93_G1263 [Corymbia citriodora subsp. variegata]
MRCICAAQSGPGTCKPGFFSNKIKIVDCTSSSMSATAAYKQPGAPLVLSETAFEAIANSSEASIVAESQEQANFISSASFCSLEVCRRKPVMEAAEGKEVCWGFQDLVECREVHDSGTP